MLSQHHRVAILNHHEHAVVSDDDGASNHPRVPERSTDSGGKQAADVRLLSCIERNPM